ncbi:MAG: UMP kinase [Alphaproteobacteria bacterium]|nr:MAG: UMP kinase [Alphaproteobacteria bacterium]
MAMDYKRILLKVSGERLAGDQHEKVLDVHAIEEIVNEIKTLKDMGVEVGVVIGGGNMIRGKETAATGIVAAQAHQMGMLATVINALALQSQLEKVGVQTRVMSAVRMDTVAEPYIRRRAMRHLEKGRVVVFAGGTGNPFFTTDTAGALRAIEIGAEVYIKATKVDGIYTADPVKNPDAKHLSDISYKDILVEDLQVMDGAAIALCRENKLPLMVCKVGDVIGAIAGTSKRTLVRE